MKLFKPVLLMILLFHFSDFVLSQHYSELEDTYNHLYKVNKEWVKYQNICSAQPIHFASEEERIQFHLESVIEYLNLNVSKDINKTTLQKRKDLLEELKIYAAQKVFPKNIYHTQRQPYFIDHEGTHCAVGYLMKISDAADLALTISKEHNYDYISDIKTKGVSNWADKYGFALEELAWIQPGYPSTIPFETIGKGTNGPIVKMATTADKLYFAGGFDLADSLPCLNVGVYENGQLSCLGTGIDGIINDIGTINYQNQLSVVVIGDLIDGGGIHYPMAVYDFNGIWNYISIPGRTGATGIAFSNPYNSVFDSELAISHSSISGHEVWSEQGSGNWSLKLSVPGLISDIEDSESGRWYAGDFDTIVEHRTGMNDTSYITHNAFMISTNSSQGPSLINGTDTALICDKVNKISVSGHVVIFGGESVEFQDPILSKYIIDSMHTILTGSDFDTFLIHPIIMDIVFKDTGNILVSGDFSHYPMIGIYGSNVLEYSLDTRLWNIFSYFDSTISTVKMWNGDMHIGGYFSFCSFGQVNHFCKMSTITSLQSIKEEPIHKVFPNPTNSNAVLQFELARACPVQIRVVDVIGNILMSENYNNTKAESYDINMTDYASAVYFVQLIVEGQTFSKPLIVSRE